MSLNGQLLGYLSVGDDEELNGGDSFLLPVHDQLSGTNQITFYNELSPTFKWGGDEPGAAVQ